MLDELYSHSMVDDRNSRDDKYPIVHLALFRPACSLWLQHGCQRVTSNGTHRIEMAPVTSDHTSCFRMTHAHDKGASLHHVMTTITMRPLSPGTDELFSNTLADERSRLYLFQNMPSYPSPDILDYVI